jgi:hypothetical protein
MHINTGTTDRILRVLVGLALIGATLTGYIGPWGWLGAVLVVTGVVGVCPAYLPFGFSTCSTKK